MIEDSLSEGYLNAAFRFRSIKAAEEFMQTALNNHVETEEPLKVEIVNIVKKCAGSGNSEMAHTE